MKSAFWSKKFLWKPKYRFLCGVRLVRMRSDIVLTLIDMKKFISNVSPFLLVTLPFFVALVLMAGLAGSELIQERIQMNASFISLPEINIFRVRLW